jgi:hypothetical protein
MHVDFVEIFEALSYQSYRRCVAKAGITFCHLAKEECEICTNKNTLQMNQLTAAIFAEI